MKLKFVAVSIFIALLVGCSKKSTEENIALAQAAVDRGDVQAAIINLKNAIVTEPNSGAARYLLGKIYIERGAALLAEKELNRALELQVDKALVYPLLAKSYNLLEKDEKIFELLEDSSELDSEVKSLIKFYSALAHLREGKPEQSKRVLFQIYDSNRDSSIGYIARAHALIADGKIEEGTSDINSALALSPNDTDLLLLSAKASVLAKDYDAAEKTFLKYYELMPEDKRIILHIVENQIRLSKFDEADINIKHILRLYKSQPYANYLQGLIYFSEGKYAEADISIGTAINNGFDNFTSRLYAGITSFRLNNYEQAYQSLNSIKKQFPEGHFGERLLLNLQLKLGYAIEASDNLEQMTNLDQEDTSLFTSVSFTLIKQGETEKAKMQLEKAESLGSKDPYDLTRIGILKLALEDLSSIVDFETALGQNPDIPEARVALANALLKKGDKSGAISVAEDWIKADPDSVDGYNFAASLYITSKEPEKAESYLRTALEISPDNPLSIIYLSEKDIAEGDAANALVMLQELVTSRPSYVPGLVKYFQTSKYLGDVNSGLNVIKQAAKSNPNIVYKFLYVKILMEERMYTEALAELNTFTDGDTLLPPYLEMLGKVYTSLEDYSNALAVFKKWTKSQPLNLNAWLSVITIHDILQNYDEALQVVKDASRNISNNQELQILNAHFSLLTNNVSGASKMIDVVEKDFGKSVMSEGLRAQIQILNGEYEQALPKLETYYSFNKNTRNAMLVAHTLVALNKIEQSIQFMEKHLEINSAHNRVRAVLAEQYLNTSPSKAVYHYQKLLDAKEDNVLVLNNLAWALGLDNKVEEALGHITKAYQLVPNDINVLDTYVRLLLKDERMSEASTIVKNASKSIKENEGYGAIKELVN